MNDRHNRIAGCQAAVDAARVQCDLAAKQLAEGFMESICDDSMNNIATLGELYCAAQETYASALDDLSDAIRR
jgi:hypothetical protein